MITQAYVRTMAAYNTAMNRSVYQAASQLSDEQRRQDQGAFFKSIHGTLCHILWGDRMWMSRFDGWPKPEAAIGESPRFIEDFATLTRDRQATDAALATWADRVTDIWLAGELAWVSGATQREMRARNDKLVVHMFNHQTHHRGQVHALLTRGGIDPGVTDLPFIVG